MKILGLNIALLIFCTITNAQTKTKTAWSAILEQNKEWYATDEAKQIADNVLLYQKSNGGWEKNIDMSKVLNDSEIKQLVESQSNPVETTIDNKATVTQIRLLAKVFDATNIEQYKKGILAGIDYLLAAQYENGGWPQFFPLKKGYYTHITYNDNAMIGVMQLLKEISKGKEPFLWMDSDRKNKSAIAIEKGLAVILKTQVIVDGKKTVWCAQHDEYTFAPAKARAYELPTLSGSESVGIVKYLMAIENPDDSVKEAIKCAVKWFHESKITGKEIIRKEDKNLPKGFDYVLIDNPNGEPLWARFYEINTNKAVFVGRDGIIKYKLEEIEYERRVGYNYLGNFAEKLILKDFPEWEKKWAQ